VSFGFKYGIPNANYYFDVGFLKNPARDKSWGFFSKPDSAMVNFIEKQTNAKEFIERVIPLIKFLAAVDQDQIFAFGCNAGRHRSYIIVELLAERLKRLGIKADIVHRNP
jgi:UPF0042 nucleotide-binding protein